MTPPNQDSEFYMVYEKGWYWVIERETNHAYAQTDSKDRAAEICEQLNRGVRDFD